MKNWCNRKDEKKHNVKQVGSEIFTGDINLLIESVEDHTQVDQLCLYLKTVDKLKISSYNWSEKRGLKIIIVLKDAVPLGDTLRKMPLVEQVYKKKKKDIAVVLNTPLSEIVPSIITTSKEVAAA